MRNFSSQDISYWLFKDRTPFTKILVAANALTFLMITFRLTVIAGLLAFNTSTVTFMPWTALTYPFLGAGDIIGILFGCYWVWVAGGSLERSWGTARYTAYFLTMSVITCAGIYVGSIVTGVNLGLAGLMLPIAGITIAFAMLNPEQQILFFLVIPLKLKYLALLDVVLVFISYVQPNPLMGIFALAGCAFSYWYVRRPSPQFSSSRFDREVIRVYPRRGFLAKLNPFWWIKEMKERRRLKKLFKNSDSDDDIGRWRP